MLAAFLLQLGIVYYLLYKYKYNYISFPTKKNLKLSFLKKFIHYHFRFRLKVLKQKLADQKVFTIIKNINLLKHFWQAVHIINSSLLPLIRLYSLSVKRSEICISLGLTKHSP